MRWSRRDFLRTLGFGAASAALASCSSQRSGAPPGAPHILLLTADDMSWDSVGCFRGLAPENTPHLDALAAGGLRFQRAQVNIAVCQPSRAVMLTGRYPHRNGVTGFDMPVRSDVATLGEILSDAGYETALVGKELHYRPLDKFRWGTVVGRGQLGAGRDPAAFASSVRDLIRRAGAAGRPFLIHANSHDPHRPFHGSLDEQHEWEGKPPPYPAPSRAYQPEEVAVPGFLPDLPSIRREVAEYCSSVRRLDDTVGAVLEVLDQEGVREDTLVVFLSDHGMAFPFAKTNCYLASVRTPLVLSWPGRIEPGRVDRDHLVTAVDLMPTLLEVAGLADPGSMRDLDGRSFLPLLEGRDQPDRDEAVAVFHSTKADRHYEMRALNRGRWGYIWNPWADGFTRFYSDSQIGLTMAELVRAARSDERIAARVRHFLYRVPEELYDLEADPDALENRVFDPAHAAELAAMRQGLHRWMRRYADPLSGLFAERIS